MDRTRVVQRRVAHNLGRFLAALASAGVRTPIEGIDDMIFISTADWLERFGIARRVAGDLFGMSRVGYQKRIRRTREQLGLDGQRATLRTRVLALIMAETTFDKARLLFLIGRADRTTEELVASILEDLVNEGLLIETRSAGNRLYRRSDSFVEPDADATLDAALQVVLQRAWPGLTEEQLVADAGLASPADIHASLQRLAAAGIVEKRDGLWVCYSYSHRFEGQEVWLASLLDHIDAVFEAMTAKLRQKAVAASPSDRLGGSTFRFELWNDHPHAAEVLDQLAELRQRYMKLRDKISDYNERHEARDGAMTVTIYVGQYITERIRQ